MWIRWFDAAKYLQEDDDKRQEGFAADEDNWSDWELLSFLRERTYELIMCIYEITNNIDTSDAEC